MSDAKFSSTCLSAAVLQLFGYRHISRVPGYPRLTSDGGFNAMEHTKPIIIVCLIKPDGMIGFTTWRCRLDARLVMLKRLRRSILPPAMHSSASNTWTYFVVPSRRMFNSFQRSSRTGRKRPFRFLSHAFMGRSGNLHGYCRANFDPCYSTPLVGVLSILLWCFFL